ncbi:MAG TPA: glycosyltransferase family 4 protein [Sphingomicrobium sp.]|nr:glycosyltransferase family 4 protein [Sphingomicrobium sp.]
MISQPKETGTPRLAYLTSYYPGTSHTFISREVEAMRSLGLDLQTFSIRPPSAAELEDPSIRAKAETTYTVLARPKSELVAAHLELLFSRPAAYLRTLGLAFDHRAPGIKGFLLSIAHFAEAILLAHELRRRGVEWLHNHFANSAATVGYLASELLELPWSFTMHGISETDYPAGLMLGRKIEAATFVACVSYFGRAQAMRLVQPKHWNKLHIIRCGLPLERLPAHAASPNKATRIICVGRLSPEKGQAGLLAAFACVVREIPDIHLILVGDGPDANELRCIADRLDLGSRVTFTGRLGESEALNEIARSDILVLSSFMEGLPIVLIEAMAIGTAVIASRVAGIPELVEDGKSGLLFTPSNWDELASCMRRLSKDEQLRQELVAAGRERVSEEFDSRKSAEQLLQLFRGDDVT